MRAPKIVIPPAVADAVAQLLPPPHPAWLDTMLVGIAEVVADQLRDRQAAPSRAKMRAAVGDLQKALAAIERLSRASVMLDDAVQSQLFENKLTHITAAAERWNAMLAGHGQDDIIDRLGHPSPKLFVAACVRALCQQIGVKPPNWKNKPAIALCAALLAWAGERAGEPARVPDLRNTQWKGPLLGVRPVGLAGELTDGAIASWQVWSQLNALRWEDRSAVFRQRLRAHKVNE